MSSRGEIVDLSPQPPEVLLRAGAPCREKWVRMDGGGVGMTVGGRVVAVSSPKLEDRNSHSSLTSFSWQVHIFKKFKMLER